MNTNDIEKIALEIETKYSEIEYFDWQQICELLVKRCG